MVAFLRQSAYRKARGRNEIRANHRQIRSMTVAQLRRMWACLSDSWKEKLAGTSENPAVQQIALKAGKRFRSELAKNPSLDADVLSGLMDDKSNDVQKCLATNPCLSEEQIRQLFSGGDPSTISELALRSDLPADLLEKMLSSKSQNISYAALWSPSATPQMVEDLYKIKKTVRQRVALAGNPSIPKKLRLKIQEGKNVEIRKSLAGNPSLTEEELLAFCVDDEVQHLVAARDGVLPVSVIKSLVEHGCAYTRERLAWRDDLDKESLLQLAQDAEADVRTVVAGRRAQDPDVYRVMVEDEDPSIKASARRGLIRAGRMTPEEIIEILEAELEEDDPRQQSCALNIAAQCDLAEEALQLVLKFGLQVISHLRYNKNLDKKLLEQLAATGESEVIREIANDRLSFPVMIEKHCASILEILKTEYGVGSHLPDLTERDCIRCSMDGEGLLWVEFCADMGSFRVEYQEQKKGKPFVEIT